MTSVTLHIAAAGAFVALIATAYSVRPGVSLPQGGIEGFDVALHHDESPATASITPPPTNTPDDVVREQVEEAQGVDPQPPQADAVDVIETVEVDADADADAGSEDRQVVAAAPPNDASASAVRFEDIPEHAQVETRPTPEVEDFIRGLMALGERAVAALPELMERAGDRVRAALTSAPARSPRNAVPAAAANTHPSSSPAPAGFKLELSPGGAAGASHGPSMGFGNVAPRYPDAERRAGHEGTVLVHVTIETTGSVSKCEVALTSGYAALDDAAVDAVKFWHFTPAKTDGVEVRAEADVPVVFRLRPDRK